MSIFQRRRRRPISQTVRYYLWPRRGWVRSVRYVAYRLRRLKGSPDSIAVGVAWGVAVSFTPFYFLHIGLAVIGSWFMGGSLLAAAIGTLFLNPLTFPFISLLTYSIGSYFLALSTSFEGMGDVSIGDIFDNFSASFEGMEVVSIGYIFDKFLEILMPFLLPMAVGGILVGIASWILVFLSVRMLVSRYRELGIENRRRKS